LSHRKLQIRVLTRILKPISLGAHSGALRRASLAQGRLKD
jgi:hypothetical protein